MDLNTERIRRDQAAGERAHEAGDAFKWQVYEFDDDGVGILDDEDHAICVVTNPHDLTGLCMSVTDARKLAEALLAACESPHLPGKVAPMPTKP